MSKPTEELRCHCGSLIARIVDQRLEVKCRRCRRVGFIRLAPDSGTFADIQWLAEPARTKTK